MVNVREKKVIIVGGGPVGAIAALILAQAGVPVAVVEKAAGVVFDYRASTFHPPTLDLLEGCGATAALLAMGLEAPVNQIRDRQAGLIAEFDFSELRNDTRHPYRLQCEQFKLVGWAYGELAAFSHVEMLMEHEFVSLRADADGVTVSASGPGGVVRELRGDFVIGADGGRSAVRKALGIAFDGFTYPENFLVSGTRFDFAAAMPGICKVNYTADPTEWYLLLQIPDMWRVIMPVDPDVEPDDAMKDESIQKALQNLLRRDEDYDIVVKGIYRVSQRVAERYRSGRAFLAGDAAHINNPLGGVGLNGGLHDAISLTAKLLDVYNGAPESVLDAYETQRKPEAITAINAMTQRNKQLLEERDPVIRRKNLDEVAGIARDPARAYAYMLKASMIESVRRCGLVEAVA